MPEDVRTSDFRLQRDGGCARLVGNDAIPLVWTRSRDDGHDRLRLAQVVDLVRNARLDEDEVASLVLDTARQAIAVIVADATLEDVEHHLEAIVNVCSGDAAGRDDGDVHRQLLCADVFSRHAELVVDAVPLPADAAAADPRQASVALNFGC